MGRALDGWYPPSLQVGRRLRAGTCLPDGPPPEPGGGLSRSLIRSHLTIEPIHAIRNDVTREPLRDPIDRLWTRSGRAQARRSGMQDRYRNLMKGMRLG